MRAITADALARRLTGRGEIAILDAREAGEFGEAHLFWAASCPLSMADLIAPGLVPRLSVPVVAVDGSEGHAEGLAATLARLGYTDVSLLAGGIAAWRAAGFELFSGVNVPSKAFGEWVEHHYRTESIDAEQLHRHREVGTPMVVLDSRTFEEFERMNIPGGISVPGGELVYRVADLVPDPATLVVVNCAGRTRSILGAESLRRAGVPNKVVALRNGTMGWELAGFSCERGAARRYPPGTPASAPVALARADRFAKAAGVRMIGRGDLAELAADPARTLYLLDVRSPEEYRAGHIPGSRNAPGGQLVQATDRWIAVRGARVALIDDIGARARMTGGWLRQMAPWDVFVVENAFDADAQHSLVNGPEARSAPPAGPTVTVAELLHGLGAPGTIVIDCALSLGYREGHIPGALWAMRSRFAALAPALAVASRVVVTSPDGWLARHSLDEVGVLTQAPAAALVGGTRAWREAGQQLAATPDDPPDAACRDVCLRPYDRTSGVEEAMRAYLSWEVGLTGQIAREASVAFGKIDA